MKLLHKIEFEFGRAGNRIRTTAVSSSLFKIREETLPFGFGVLQQYILFRVEIGKSFSTTYSISAFLVAIIRREKDCGLY
ncbi:uncharacterized protein Bfra_010935 [Botrytis fragariae]|uniref:Uncharacterized protein n=1 Tax=Botrytis fragariae TaxID=1964551 RepID=A0A8H6AM19_9HELO|nr:uncharacterized protein Bfra_010935 [Botrytis fragariae]KAF5869735.1 hypothetical protein Bfra_010935 [Botrytis fragariae]